MRDVVKTENIKNGNSNNIPTYEQLEKNLMESSKLIDDILLKKYLHKLENLEIIPLKEDMKKIRNIRLFRVTEMVYQRNEYSTYKFASVFGALQSSNCGAFIIADSDGSKTEFYMGVRNFDINRTSKSLKDTLKNALLGQFPGAKVSDLLDSDVEKLTSTFSNKNISSVSCVATNKDDEFKDNETFIQGLEKLALAMQGKKYTAIVLAKSISKNQLGNVRRSYETIYTQLSPFANMQLSYGSNTAISISEAVSHGITTGTTVTTSTSTSVGTSKTRSQTKNESVSKSNNLVKAVGQAILGIASVATAPLTGGASLVAAGAIMAGQVGLNAYNPPTVTTGYSISDSETRSENETRGESVGENSGVSDTNTHTEGSTSGKTENMQLTMQNKTLINILEKVDLQLKRLDECESLGMWECAAYFLADSQETAEMAAGTYKSIMKGSKSCIENSAINSWGRVGNDKFKLVGLRDYIVNFIHPIFSYNTEHGVLPVSAASLLSSNELAIQMGLPRKSICGFPVIEHAEFGRDVVAVNGKNDQQNISVGQICGMGALTNTDVCLDVNTLAMHTFVTGSTGSGKSTVIYSLLDKLMNTAVKNDKHKKIKFMVIEPAKGEYKDRFGYYSNVNVYGTNAKKTPLLRINPFSFPEDVHVLEHIDRLVEIFNVCWPMYAAMPAVLKDSIERAYVASGWKLDVSECKYHNTNGEPLYPSFVDVLNQINVVIDESQYSKDSKGDYKGALCTRLKSLTNGLNGRIFTSNEIAGQELFDENVVVDLSRVGSSETKSLIMGLLIMKLQEYRMANAKAGNQALQHITVLEEAHNILKRTSTEQSSESSNLLGKSVEMLANSIAEMRTYGEGFVIADQAPGLMDMSVIRNTNTKIILRLPDISDRELVGKAVALNDEQIIELSKLETFVAAVYQNNWLEPVLCKVHTNFKESRKYEKADKGLKCSDYKKDVINYLTTSPELKDFLGRKYLERLYSRCFNINIPVEAKLAIWEYIKATDKNTIEVTRGTALYSIFNAGFAFGVAKNFEHDFNSWYKKMCEILELNADDYVDKERKLIISILLQEKLNRDATKENVELFEKFIPYCGRLV